MKKATRLLILTAFVLPLLLMTRAYAGGPGPGQRMTNSFERQRLGIDPIGVIQNNPYASRLQSTDPFRPNTQQDANGVTGWRPLQPENNPLNLEDPIGQPGPDINRNNLFQRSIVAGHDHFPDAGRPAWDPSNNGGGTAPIDGGISLLLAAGLGLGIKRAKARKQTV